MHAGLRQRQPKVATQGFLAVPSLQEIRSMPVAASWTCLFLILGSRKSHQLLFFDSATLLFPSKFLSLFFNLFLPTYATLPDS